MAVAIGAIGAAAISAGASAYNQNRANSANASATRASRAHSIRMFNAEKRYNTRMSNTAVKRRMLDMKHSGINPILAAKYDASSPSASALGYQTIPNQPGQFVSDGIAGANSAISLEQAEAQIANIEATTVKTLGETSKGQWLINEAGGMKELASFLLDNPELKKDVDAFIASDNISMAIKVIMSMMGLEEPKQNDGNPIVVPITEGIDDPRNTEGRQ